MPTDNMSIWAKLLIFQMLIRSNPDGNGLGPDLAESWEASDDKMTYTFHLRKNAMFSDGTPVKASDAKFCLNRCATIDGSPYGSMFPKMTMDTPDDHTLVVKLAQPWGPFLEAVSVTAPASSPRPISRRSATRCSATSRSDPAPSSSSNGPRAIAS